MKIKEGFLLKKITGNNVIVPLGENLVDFSAMITLNDTGAFIWGLLQEDTTFDELVDAIIKEYSLDKDTATADVEHFINLLKNERLLEE